ncbi:MAG: protease complex subunit PrcB family protein [Pyrinomonadaceae bacterium]|nr:protease complex subunit PrcB family protein [Pyrinomonadaceae bacterium]
MMIKKLSALVFVGVAWAGSLSSLYCNQQGRKQLPQDSNSTGKPIPGHRERSGVTNGEIKELAARNHSTIFESFVLIARDSKTYEALRIASPSLPEQNAEFFETNVVVAVFLGQRRTGGYSIEIANGHDGSLRIVEHSPPKGAMVKMVLSAPFKVVAIPVQTDRPMELALDETWKKRLRGYRVTSGQVLVTGGFAGVNQRRSLEGTVGIMRAGELATFIFDLRSQAGQETKQLKDAASCLVKNPLQVSLPRLNSTTLTGAIESPFQVTGEFLDEERELRLSLQTIASSNISDNFAATGQLTAVATDPPSPKLQ